MAGLADSGLHDYELIKLSADYTRGEVSLEMKDPLGQPESLILGGVISVEMTRTRPWGEGSHRISPQTATAGADSPRYS
ncbi:hypothetical protein [Ruminococcus albus]|uniref:Uncharacterized protein n=1 Tax=Ruminococcus albus (strain ATCC 27210 / DSM 20455 / JCM 14654 / NCDO 2250 / 7) TaxID=697329 RepID=E6UIJ8_RUMA7|nr:hypothetical protein [Ruminococcus albus]ADU23343.1 hypothetical protein Rumal_2877 [Ruminococcus albus 7 = DSM 20455]